MYEILEFLKDLSANNSKDWMDANRKRYLTVKEIWINQCTDLLLKLKEIDGATFSTVAPKQTISRITNNRRFHPDKPIYKDFFSFSVMDRHDGYCNIYVSISPKSSFLGCGFPKPEGKTLKSIRQAIDFDGEILERILQDKAFNEYYGGLSNWGGELKSSPQGYSKNHEHIQLLRHKTFIVSREISKKESLSIDFTDLVTQGYHLSLPFKEYLKQAVSV